MPSQPAILDIGCGPGMQTLDLARACPGATLTALDNHQPFLDVLQVNTAAAGLSERVKTANGSMFELNFSQASFDLIWSEGAIYIIGFEAGLKAWKPLIRPEGYLVASEISWLKPGAPEELLRFWTEAYPEIHSISENLKIAEQCGYHPVGLYILPPSRW